MCGLTVPRHTSMGFLFPVWLPVCAQLAIGNVMDGALDAEIRADRQLQPKTLAKEAFAAAWPIFTSFQQLPLLTVALAWPGRANKNATTHYAFLPTAAHSTIGPPTLHTSNVTSGLGKSRRKFQAVVCGTCFCTALHSG